MLSRITRRGKPSNIVKGLYLAFAIASGVGLCLALLLGIAAAFLALPLSLAGVSTGWITWFLENVVLWLDGASLVILLGGWIAIRVLYALEQAIVWLNAQIREASE